MGRFQFHKLIIFTLLIWGSLCLFPHTANAQLRPNYYSKTCPNVEKIVRQVVQQKISQTFVTIPAVLRLFFHDCIVNVYVYIFLQFTVIYGKKEPGLSHSLF